MLRLRRAKRRIERTEKQDTKDWRRTYQTGRRECLLRYLISTFVIDMTVCYPGGRDDVVSCRLSPIKPACSDIGRMRTTSCCVNRRVGYSDVERSLDIRTCSIDSASNGGCSHIVVIAATLGIYGCITDTDASYCFNTDGSDSGSKITRLHITFASRRQGDIADNDVPARVVRAVGSGIAAIPALPAPPVDVSTSLRSRPVIVTVLPCAT